MSYSERPQHNDEICTILGYLFRCGPKLGEPLNGGNVHVRKAIQRSMDSGEGCVRVQTGEWKLLLLTQITLALIT